MRTSRWLGFIGFAFVTSAATVAEEPFSFERAPGKLPKDIVPHRYELRLAVNIDEASVHGRETIRIEVRKATRQVVLNSVGQKFTAASIENSAGQSTPLPWKNDEKEQTLTLQSADELAPGKYALTLEWDAKLTEQAEGLFITRYQAGTEEKRAVATQMEPCDARRMFPCWDEPAFRAEFQLSAVVPEKHLAVSNTPVVKETPKENGFKEVDFAPTPPMASYLVAFCSGEFEQLKDEVDGVQLRVITTEGKIEQARFALEATRKILPYYNEYFGVHYPLPKLDQFCFPGFPAGGMENWGSIFYVDTAMLFDPKTSAQATKEHVFAVVAHEIAHQWFGDLVTMGWWDNLWLNEGFASWMGTKATDHFNPEWQVWLRAANRTETAMALDARATTHPIQRPVTDEHQANDVFDEITYSKGQAFLRMLETYLGEDTFRDGIRTYIKQHAYGNTTTADLWSALGAASGKPVAKIAAGWTEQPGFPVVHLALSADASTLTLSQERFTIHQANAKPLTWNTPVAFAAIDSLTHPRVELLGAEPQNIAWMQGDVPIKGNAGANGYYRVSYEEKAFRKLVEIAPAMPEADRLNLLNDAWALLEADRLPAADCLDLIGKLAPGEKGYAVWSALIRILWFIDALEHHQPSEDGFHKWSVELLAPQLGRLGWEAKAGEPQLASELRSQLISALGAWGDTEVQKHAVALYATYRTDPISVSGDILGSVLFLVGRGADETVYDDLHQRALRENSTELKDEFYGALAASQNPDLARKTLEIALSDELPPRWASALVPRVATTGEHPDLAWEFAQKNLDNLFAKLSSNGADRYVPNLFRSFSDSAYADELESFARRNLPPEAGYAVSKAADEIRFKADFKQRFLPELSKWIAR
jgi:aminopeptidase N